jgi:hypothetical protein
MNLKEHHAIWRFSKKKVIDSMPGEIHMFFKLKKVENADRDKSTLDVRSF